MYCIKTCFGIFLIVALAGHVAAVSAQTPTRRGVQQQTVTCNSNDNRRQTCRVRNWSDARLVRQISRTACVRGRNWGLQRGVLWVDNGCRGTFAQVQSRRYTGSDHGRTRGGHAAPRHGSDRNRQISLSCASNGNHYQMCRVDVGTRGTVRLQHQDSKTRCVLNRNWGWNRAGVWVNHGCRGRFTVYRAGR